MITIESLMTLVMMIGETKSFAVKDYGQFIYLTRKKAHYVETAIIEVLMRLLD